MLGSAGCKSKNAAAPIVSHAGQDPALANLAQPYTGGNAGGYNSNGQPTRVLGQSQGYDPQSNSENYGNHPQSPAPIIYQAPAGSPAPYQQGYDPNAQGYDPNAQGYDPNAQGYDPNAQGYGDAEQAGEDAIAETDQAPPPLPEYDQPPAPDPNYIWTPGYWGDAPTGYYWVPGAWCAPPFYGALWTPPWWGFYGNRYRFHRGYWGPHVGYYGGIDYGFGYVGTGYYGGYWRGHDFVYNRAVTNVNPRVIHEFYDRPVVFNGREYGPHPRDRVSYNGGRGGRDVQPRPEELAAMREAHYPAVAAQRDLRLAAASNRGQFFRADGGRPAQAFASRPVGARETIAATPREQPFNRGPAGGGAPGNAQPLRPEPGRPAPGFRKGNHGARPGEAGRPGSAGDLRRIDRAGAPASTPEQRPTNEPRGFTGARPDAGTQPRTDFGQQRPGFNGSRPRGDAQGREFPGQRPGGYTQPQEQRPGVQPQPQRPTPDQPAPRSFNQPDTARPRPNFEAQRPNYRNQQPAAVQPPPRNYSTPRDVQPQAQPARPSYQPRPNFEAQRPSAPPVRQEQPNFRPQEIPRAAPAPQARPEQAPRAAPAQAPHAAPAPRGGGDHGGGDRGHR